MTWLSDLPIQRKLGYAMLVTTSVALTLACAIFLGVEYRGYRRNLVHTVETLARITADNSTAAIAFGDPAGARQNLEALRAEPQVVAATLFDADGKVFARYTSLPQQVARIDPGGAIGVRFDSGNVFVVQPVVEGSRRLGTLHLQATLNLIYGRMRDYSLIVLGVLALAFGLAGLVASALRRTIARPILELANTARAVSGHQDYSRRAQQYGRDELGQLTATFNAMLARTQAAVGELRESEWAHRELVRALPTAAYMCDADGRITIFNEAAVALWGRTPELGREFWCGSHRIYRADGTPMDLDQCPMAVALRQARPVRGVEIIIERPDGSRRNVLPHPEPIRDTSGKLVGIVNMLVDITEEKKAGEAARQLAAIVESSDDAIISKNLDGVIRTWNRGAEALFGYAPEKTIGQPITLLIPPERHDEETSILARIRNGEPVEHFETVRRRQDGSLIEVSITVSPIKDATGRVIGASKIARDISGRRRAEEQANFLGSLSQQLSAVTDPNDILRVAARAIGNHLKVDRCFFCTFGIDATQIVVKEDWAREGLPGIEGAYTTADFGTPELWRAMAEGPLAIHDKATDVLTRNLGPGYDALRIGAHATAPFVRDGRWVASLAVTTEMPRAWHKDEMALLENALSRVWPMVERAISQAALRESERRQRELMRALPVACFTVDAEGWLTFFNHAAVQLWGRAPDLGTSRWSGAIATTTLDGQPILPEESAVAVALRERRAVRDSETLVHRPDGTQRWVSSYPDPIFDAFGKVTGVVNVVMDVTEERTAHEKIQKAAERLSLAIASANLGDWNWDAATDRISLSPRTCEIYGVVSGPDLTRSQMRELLHPDDRKRAVQALRHSLETGVDYDIEYRVNRSDGSQCWVAAKGRAIFAGDGRVSGMVGVVQDITARMQADIELKRARDEALEASRAKDDFLAALSHELRTPLNPVLLIASDSASNLDLPAPVRADFELIRKNVDLEARLIDDLLDLTRITRGKVLLDQKPCDAHAILEDALLNVRAEVAEKNLDVKVEMKAAQAVVLADPVRLQQAFWNVLKNAVKFTPVGGRITVETQATADGERIAVKVADTGIGMTPEELERAFQAFSQGDHAASGSHLHRFGGLGLGLAITKMLVDLHGGDIQASSPGRDQGSTFVIALNLHAKSAAASNGQSVRGPEFEGESTPPFARERRDSRPATGRKILLVEDHGPTRETLLQLLDNRNFAVTAVESATKAHAAALATEFDIVISDVGLPDRNGYDLMAELRTIRPLMAGIALSGYGMEEDLDRSRAAGFSAHLVKPVTIGMLEETISQLLA